MQYEVYKESGIANRHERKTMESTLQNPAAIAAKTTARGLTIIFWIITTLFCLEMGFTAYAELRLPEVAAAFTRLGFPAYFREELSWAKLLGVVLLLAPAPTRLKEWAHAGFAIDLASALIAHNAVGDGPEAWGWAAATSVLWALSYCFWRRLQTTPAITRPGAYSHSQRS
jgi:DoxX-like family